MKKILIVAAHPDDEILGCGATVARYVKEGNNAYVLILGEGVTSRDENIDRGKRKNELEELKISAHKANRIIGVKKIFMYDFPDNRFDTVALLDIIKVIEKVKRQIKPDIIYTHHRADLNIDHRIVYNAVLTSCRPLEKETVKKIYSFEVPSSTEWNYPNTFNPNTFVEINKTISKKIEALKCYEGELKKFPHPRSEEGVKILAKYRGIESGHRYVEAFQLVRDLVKVK